MVKESNETLILLIESLVMGHIKDGCQGGQQNTKGAISSSLEQLRR